MVWCNSHTAGHDVSNHQFEPEYGAKNTTSYYYTAVVLIFLSYPRHGDTAESTPLKVTSTHEKNSYLRKGILEMVVVVH